MHTDTHTQTPHTRARTRASLILLTLLVICCLNIDASAQRRNNNRRNATSTNTAPPVVTLSADNQLVTVCATERASMGGAARNQVRLNANSSGFTTGGLRYRYVTNGGKIVGDGADVMWDLTGVQPGAYTASVEVDNGLDETCRAFSSATVVARDCPPVPCPNVRVTGSDTVEAGTPVNFVANVGGGETVPTYNWTVSAGTITSGQGTNAITVDTTGIGGQTVEARLQLAGLDPNCAATANFATPVTARPVARKFDEFPSVAFDDDKARLDNLAIELQNDTNARAFIVVYAGRRSRADQATRLGSRARTYLTTMRGIDASRITVVGGGTRERDTYELYIVPLGADPPTVGR